MFKNLISVIDEIMYGNSIRTEEEAREKLKEATEELLSNKSRFKWDAECEFGLLSLDDDQYDEDEVEENENLKPWPSTKTTWN